MIQHYKYLYLYKNIRVYSGVILIKSAFWMVITVILCCCACACITGTSPEGSSSGISVVDKTPRDEPGKIPLELAMGELDWYSPSDSSIGNNKTIHQVHGSGVDLQGNASSWVLGVRDGEMSYLLIYGQNGWRQVAWGEPFTSPRISFNATITPNHLYEQNQGIIGDALKKGNVTESDIDLSDDIYTVTVRSSVGIALIGFNSTTGELLSHID